MIIGIAGHARAGKDTLGGYLIKCLKERNNRTFIQTAFAEQLKFVCQEHFSLSDDQLWGDKKEISDLRYKKSDSEFWTPREIMQNLGSFYRSIDYDFWVKALDNYLKQNKIEDTIITDVRHINECEYVKNNNGVLIKIIRENADEIHGMTHESETSLDDKSSNYFDIEINNDGSLEDLYTAAENMSDAIISIENLITKGRKV